MSAFPYQFPFNIPSSGLKSPWTICKLWFRHNLYVGCVALCQHKASKIFVDLTRQVTHLLIHQGNVFLLLFFSLRLAWCRYDWSRFTTTRSFIITRVTKPGLRSDKLRFTNILSSRQAETPSQHDRRRKKPFEVRGLVNTFLYVHWSL